MLRAALPEVPLAETDDRPTWMRLISLAWPVIGLNVLNVLALAVDTAMLGRIENADAALTGLGYSVQILFLMMVAMMGLTVGTVAFVSRAHGAGSDERVNHILFQSTMLTLGLGLTVAVVGNAIAVPMLRLLGATDATLGAGLDYLRPMMLGTALNYLNILFGATLRGVGNTRIPFGIALLSNAVNVVVNYGLILGNFGLPALGITGAAIGTITSHAFAVTVMVVLLRRDWVPGVRPTFRPRPLDIPLARELIRVGAPAAADMVVFNAGFLSIIGMLGRIDQAAVAAHGIGLRIQALAFVPGMSVSQATGAMVGNALGADDVEEAKGVLRSAMVLCVAIMGTLAVLILSQAPELVALVDVDPNSEMGRYSVMWMRQLGWCMPVVGVWIAFSGVFQGSGATWISLRINALVTFFIQIPGSWILGFPLGLGAWGVWFAFPASFAIKALLGWIAYRQGLWARTGEKA